MYFFKLSSFSADRRGLKIKNGSFSNVSTVLRSTQKCLKKIARSGKESQSLWRRQCWYWAKPNQEIDGIHFKKRFWFVIRPSWEPALLTRFLEITELAVQKQEKNKNKGNVQTSIISNDRPIICLIVQCFKADREHLSGGKRHYRRATYRVSFWPSGAIDNKKLPLNKILTFTLPLDIYSQPATFALTALPRWTEKAALLRFHS